MNDFFARIFLFNLLLFLSFSVQSQQVTLSGKVKNQQSGEVIPFVTITLQSQADSILIAGTITNEQGNFTLDNINPGKYILKTSFVGYQILKMPVFVGKLNSFLDLGTLILTEDSQMLNELVIEGEKSTISNELNKKTFDIEDNLSQTGGSILDAMRALPGITIDQEGKVILRGSDKVTVLVDGKQSALTGFGNQKSLDNIPSANIERIEIITNPSAKFNAAGMAGIVNIIFKKDQKKGFSGEVGLNLGMGAVTRRRDDLPTTLGSFSANPKVTPSLNLNYRTPKLTFFLQSSILFQEKLPNNEFTIRFYEDGRVISSQVAENRQQTHYLVKGGVDWNWNKNNTLTLSGIFDYESHVDTSRVPFLNSHLDNSRNRFYAWNEEEITGLANISLNYKHQFPQTGHSISSEFQFTRGWEDESYFLQDSSAIRQSGDTTMLLAEEYTTSISLDYVKPLLSGRVEIGSRLQWRRIPVSYTIGRGESSIIYLGLGDESRWGENIYAGYINYIFERPKYDIEAGLRAEQTDVFYNLAANNIYYDQNDAYDYFELFPNIRFTWNINLNNHISVFYNRRIDRPGEPELRVFPKYDDPELLKVGNPYLRPQFTQNLELAYQLEWNEGSIYFAGYQRWITNQFLRIYNEDNSSAGNIINKIYQNTADASNLGLELILSQKVNDLWKFNFSLNWYLIDIEQHEGVLLFPEVRSYTLSASEDDTWDVKMNHQFEFKKGFKLQLTGIYYAPRNVPQGVASARSSIDVGFSQKILKSKGEISGTFTDLFNRFGIQEDLIGSGFTALYENFYETQVFRLGFKYQF